MPRLELAEGFYDDFDRFINHMRRFDVADPVARIAEIIQALQILTFSPLIGRRSCGGKRELVIGRDERGYIALYRFSPHRDVVSILAIRNHSERSYKHHH
jgi:toxin ParE1/3/4